MRVLVITPAALLLGCSPDFDSFAELCRMEAGVIVQDRALWKQYVSRLVADHRRLSSGAQQYGSFLKPSETDGFNLLNEVANGKVLPVDERPHRNDYQLTNDGKPVATLRNYTLRWQGFAAGQSVSCTIEHPETYGIRVLANQQPQKE